MSLRKHKYKQQLEELKSWLQGRREQLVAETKGKDYDAFREGMKSMCAEVLAKLTEDEIVEQRKDEEARAKRSETRRAKRQAKDERQLWCTECLWTGPAKDALVEGEHICPNCAGEDLKRGTGPQERR
jgi:hypothetical protein